METIIGLTEEIVVVGAKGSRKLVARIDTGATKCSVDKELAKELDFGSVIKKRVVKSASGVSHREVINFKVRFKGKTLSGNATIADRSHMKYKVLIGQNILKKGKFLIDPNRD
jgi:hypothetical protein